MRDPRHLLQRVAVRFRGRNPQQALPLIDLEGKDPVPFAGIHRQAAERSGVDAGVIQVDGVEVELQ